MSVMFSGSLGAAVGVVAVVVLIVAAVVVLVVSSAVVPDVSDRCGMTNTTTTSATTAATATAAGITAFLRRHHGRGRACWTGGDPPAGEARVPRSPQQRIRRG